jgi:hypothetical protein
MHHLSGQELASNRASLLHFNAGIWEGCFIRLDRSGRELERFGSHLDVTDRQGTIHADLTNTVTGTVRSMQFVDPPPEMQISPDGHWSLGPDRIGPWPWVCELSLVWGQRRRRVIVRHDSTSLESLVLVCESRPGTPHEAPAGPLQLSGQALNTEQWQWFDSSSAALQITTQRQRRVGTVERVALSWQPEAGRVLRLERTYNEHGLLVPL